MDFAVPRHRAPASTTNLPEPGAATFALSDLSPGTSGRITGLADDGVGGVLVKRLRNLGFVPGRVVTPLRRAPLGDPVVYRVADYELCLRHHEARIVRVETITKDDKDVEAAAESAPAAEAETGKTVPSTEPVAGILGEGQRQ